jgi:hypothetical protein
MRHYRIDGVERAEEVDRQGCFEPEPGFAKLVGDCETETARTAGDNSYLSAANLIGLGQRRAHQIGCGKR